MGDETRNNHEENRRTTYELLHPTQNSVPSCIMFPPNAPHVEVKQGLLAILLDFRGKDNENPYFHVRAFEEVISSFYAQNVIEIAKFVSFLFLLRIRQEVATDYLDEIAENSNTWTRPSPMDSTNRTRPSFKINLPLLHVIKQVPAYAKVIKDLCTIKRNHHMKKPTFLIEQVSAIIQHKTPPKSCQSIRI